MSRRGQGKTHNIYQISVAHATRCVDAGRPGHVLRLLSIEHEKISDWEKSLQRCKSRQKQSRLRANIKAAKARVDGYNAVDREFVASCPQRK